MSIDNDVRIIGMKFEPSDIMINPGDTVTWVNSDDLPHTVTEDTGAWTSGKIEAGQAFSRQFCDTGALSYHCQIHPAMKGIVSIA